MQSRDYILVADDEPLIRNFAARVLRDAGFEVLEAADGVEALEVFEQVRRDVRVLATDLVMPRMNGLELVQKITSLNPGVSVILMSGYSSDELDQRGLKPPCGFLHKPFHAEALVEEVDRCLKVSP